MSSRGTSEDTLSAALEAYFTRLDRGELPDEQEYLSQYPECAEELRGVFQDLQFLRSKIAEHVVPAEPPAKQSTHPPPGPSAVVSSAAFLRPKDSSGFRGDSSGPGASGSMLFGESVSPDLPRIPGFRVLEELGNGSQGVVYKAEQLSTRRLVALKVVRDGAFASLSDRRRFENEVHLASRLSHPHVVAVYECGRDAGRDYFAMEFVEGEPLDLFCSKTGMIPRETVRLFLKICRAVSYAHQQGVLHRDLKPSNVLIDAGGDPHILDFGLAKPLVDASDGADTTLTHVGHFAGTWSYASPEQVRLDPLRVDVRSDVYTLGVIVYEMLTDCSPYRVSQTSREELTKYILEMPPIPPAGILREIDRDLETIVLKTLEKDPGDRYQSAAALADDLQRYLAGEAIEARRTHTWYVLSRLIQRHRWQVAGMAAALILLVGVTALLWILYCQSQAARATGEVRAEIGRNSQRFALEKLDELHRADNTLAAIREKFGPLVDARHLTAANVELPQGISRFIATIPPELSQAVRRPGEPMPESAAAWLLSGDSTLDEATVLLNSSAVYFGGQIDLSEGRALDTYPTGLGLAEQAAEALLGRATLQHESGNRKGALESLNAVRKVAWNLGDGRMLHQKTFSYRVRSNLYRTVLWIMRDGLQGPDKLRAYLRWAQDDPPLAEIRLALISERTKLAQLIAGASLGDRGGVIGHLDLDLLDSQTGGLVTASGQLTDQARKSVTAITPQAALQVIDRYLQEVEGWDGLPLARLEERARSISESLRSEPAWEVLQVLIPDYHAFFNQQTHCRALRTAVLLFGRICQSRIEGGHWPTSLERVLSNASPLDLRDPYTDQPFGYLLESGLPLLYSRNLDGVDHAGLDGPWGKEGTDMRVFGPHWGAGVGR